MTAQGVRANQKRKEPYQTLSGQTLFLGSETCKERLGREQNRHKARGRKGVVPWVYGLRIKPVPFFFFEPTRYPGLWRGWSRSPHPAVVLLFFYLGLDSGWGPISGETGFFDGWKCRWSVPVGKIPGKIVALRVLIIGRRGEDRRRRRGTVARNHDGASRGQV